MNIKDNAKRVVRKDNDLAKGLLDNESSRMLQTSKTLLQKHNKNSCRTTSA